MVEVIFEKIKTLVIAMLTACFVLYLMYHFSESLAEFAADMTEGVSMSNMAIKPQTLYKAGMAALSAAGGGAEARAGSLDKESAGRGGAEDKLSTGGGGGGAKDKLSTGGGGSKDKLSTGGGEASDKMSAGTGDSGGGEGDGRAKLAAKVADKAGQMKEKLNIKAPGSGFSASDRVSAPVKGEDVPRDNNGPVESGASDKTPSSVNVNDRSKGGKR
jgi:hypothetical protein